MIKNNNRILLKQKIYDFLNNEIDIIELENSGLFKADKNDETELLKSVFHAVQHFYMDFNELNHKEKEKIKLKLKKIADSLIEDDKCLKDSISIFFNNPYS